MFFFQFLDDPVQFQARELFHEYLAIQMVDFMLQADREQAVGMQFERLALPVKRAQGDLLCACHFLVNAGYRQTAFLAGFFTFPVEDFRVDEYLQGILFFGKIDDQQPDMLIHLGGGQADSRGGIHGFGHVIDKLL